MQTNQSPDLYPQLAPNLTHKTWAPISAALCPKAQWNYSNLPILNCFLCLNLPLPRKPSKDCGLMTSPQPLPASCLLPPGDHLGVGAGVEGEGSCVQWYKGFLQWQGPLVLPLNHTYIN